MWSLPGPPAAQRLPWPAAAAADGFSPQPEVRVAQALPRGAPLVVLAAGGPSGSARGRYGLVAIPAATTPLSSDDPNAVANAIDTTRPDAMRVVAFGYELGAAALRLPPRRPPVGLPAGLVIDIAAALVVDHAQQQMTLWSEDRAAGAQLRAAVERLPMAAPLSCAAATGDPAPPPWLCSRRSSAAPTPLRPLTTDAEHMRRIARAQQAIAAGEIYQANLTRRLLVEVDFDPLSALALLCHRNPVFHAAYVRTRDLELLSNSMETLLHYDARTRLAESFPIKGTYARLEHVAAHVDAAQGRRLLHDEKERAEHMMIVDLVRNDLGRVAIPGSVSVPVLMGLEAYVGVWHAVSTVRASLAPACSGGALMQSLFPGGSVTGAPKRRAVQLLAEFENEPRGFYTGSLAVITPGGSIGASILIRTLVRHADGWNLAVGGGIVADSDPEREVRETWQKIEVFRRVLDVAS